MFIPDLTDKLFQDILHGNNTVGAAEFIDDDGNMRFFRLHFLQKRTNLCILRHKESRADDAAQRFVRVVNMVMKIFLIYNSHNVVNIIVVYRQPGKAGVGEGFCNLGFCRIERNADHVDTRGENLRSFHFHKSDGILDQIAFLVIDVALLGRFLDDGHQLLVGDAVGFRGFENAGEKLLPLGEEKRHRCQEQHQDMKKRR